ncbi:hypothetical protein Z043_123532 [Scleropages formosus]|uniref:Golgi integral membrane protein 4-like n=1 Tax=Scleropages formosus TaxID=113540 RepID=A0A0P7UHE8_SCLFO|nr:hypothetical protein Z043_123532 [Scleropages formosus]
MQSKRLLRQNQHDDLKKQFYDLQEQHRELSDSHGKALDEHRKRFDELQETKELEISKLKENMYNLREENKQLRKAHQDVHLQLQDARQQHKDLKSAHERLAVTLEDHKSALSVAQRHLSSPGPDGLDATNPVVSLSSGVKAEVEQLKKLKVSGADAHADARRAVEADSAANQQRVTLEQAQAMKVTNSTFAVQVEHRREGGAQQMAGAAPPDDGTREEQHRHRRIGMSAWTLTAFRGRRTPTARERKPCEKRIFCVTEGGVPAHRGIEEERERHREDDPNNQGEDELDDAEEQREERPLEQRMGEEQGRPAADEQLVMAGNPDQQEDTLDEQYQEEAEEEVREHFAGGQKQEGEEEEEEEEEDAYNEENVEPNNTKRDGGPHADTRGAAKEPEPNEEENYEEEEGDLEEEEGGAKDTRTNRRAEIPTSAGVPGKRYKMPDVKPPRILDTRSLHVGRGRSTRAPYCAPTRVLGRTSAPGSQDGARPRGDGRFATHRVFGQLGNSVEDLQLWQAGEHAAERGEHTSLCENTHSPWARSRGSKAPGSSDAPVASAKHSPRVSVTDGTPRSSPGSGALSSPTSVHCVSPLGFSRDGRRKAHGLRRRVSDSSGAAPSSTSSPSDPMAFSDRHRCWIRGTAGSCRIDAPGGIVGNPPWQADRTQVPQCVVHQLEALYADQSAQDSAEANAAGAQVLTGVAAIPESGLRPAESLRLDARATEDVGSPSSEDRDDWDLGALLTTPEELGEPFTQDAC